LYTSCYKEAESLFLYTYAMIWGCVLTTTGEAQRDIKTNHMCCRHSLCTTVLISRLFRKGCDAPGLYVRDILSTIERVPHDLELSVWPWGAGDLAAWWSVTRCFHVLPCRVQVRGGDFHKNHITSFRFKNGIVPISNDLISFNVWEQLVFANASLVTWLLCIYLS